MLKILERLPCWCFPVHTLVKVRSQSCLHVNNVPCTEYDTDHSHFTSTFCRLSGNLKTLHTAVFVNYAQTPYSLSYCSRSLVRCQAGIRDFPLPQNVTKGSAPPSPPHSLVLIQWVPEACFPRVKTAGTCGCQLSSVYRRGLV
jgi:hypothetical protein